MLSINSDVGSLMHTPHISMMKSHFISMQILMRMQQHIRNVCEKAINGNPNMCSDPIASKFVSKRFNDVHHDAHVPVHTSDQHIVFCLDCSILNIAHATEHTFNGYCVYKCTLHIPCGRRLMLDDDDGDEWTQLMNNEWMRRRTHIWCTWVCNWNGGWIWQIVGQSGCDKIANKTTNEHMARSVPIFAAH